MEPVSKWYAVIKHTSNFKIVLPDCNQQLVYDILLTNPKFV